MKATRALEMRSLLMVYGLLALLCLGASFYYFQDPFFYWKSSKSFSFGFWMIPLLAGFFWWILISGCTRFFGWAQDIQKVFAQVLTPISYLQIVLLATLTAFIEEWFFRGLMLDHLGFIFSIVIYALSHLILERKLWVWTPISLLIGLILSLLFQATGSLVYVSLFHSLLNIIGLIQLNKATEQVHATS